MNTAELKQYLVTDPQVQQIVADRHSGEEIKDRMEANTWHTEKVEG